MTESLHYLSCEKFTVLVQVTDGKITFAPPIVRRFHGSPLIALRRWMRRFDGFREEQL